MNSHQSAIPRRITQNAILIALVMGLIVHHLMDTPGVGLNLPLSVLTLILGLRVMAQLNRIPARGPGQPLLWTALLFSLTFVWQDSTVLHLLNGFALLVCLSLALPTFREGRLARGGVFHYVVMWVGSALSVFVGALLLISETRWTREKTEPSTSSGRNAALLRGVVITVPVLLVFTLLLRSADAAFNSLLDGLFSWNLSAFLVQVPGILGTAYLALGSMHLSLLNTPLPEPAGDLRTMVRLGWTESSMLLSALTVLFVAFIGVQFAYFFGGQDQITALTGLTYAEYARKGFFEMIFTATLMLGLLLLVYRLQDSKVHLLLLYKGLNLTLILCVLVMLLSAWKRMMLYVSTYGQTEDRLLTLIFMVWVGLVLVWFMVMLFQKTYDRFTFGSIVLGLVLIAGMNFLQPTRIIVQTNLNRELPLSPEDWSHFRRLGADAAPLVLPRLQNAPNCRTVLESWQQDLAEKQDWRSWNVRRSQATEQMDAAGDVCAREPDPS
ncbi:DUF4153 domain-containing protein [Deinococcus cellulosilyticus]|uniref:Uncharacterized protein n=1 Tax=Deinococcus cellulosilyticus (strain DSM 18568 / NBRC 106333 / KACC 11606 / 5516J-15) TaxID=1223518 RepID=A0A511N080_DEIC1|nr:DUF4173 domain-containing protein [Deinococcus cellulosilyticus]GEM45847.1 hypothetical protein DC3_14820 [Deinococcus cellulosilyticus NBRC 106333 = KACC 11606]